MKIKHSVSAVLASTLVLASCNAFTPNTSGVVGGIGQNPCLENAWKSSKYCRNGAAVTEISKVQFVGTHQLVLESIPLSLQRTGLALPLIANALTSAALPAGAQVEFFVDGRSIGKVAASSLNDKTHQFFELLKDLLPGRHEATAILTAPDGTILAESNAITFDVPEPTTATAIGLLNPSTQQPVVPGTPLKALAAARLPEGGSVVFRFNGREVTGTLQPDGTYAFNLDTTGLNPGTYPITAIVKDANGNTVATSNVKDVIIRAPLTTTSAPDLSLFNLGGRSAFSQGSIAPLTGLLTLPDNLKKPGQRIQFFANGQPIGETNVNSSGHYQLDWATQPFNPGTYTLTAKVINADGSLVVQSNALPLVITGAEVAAPGVQLGGLPTQAQPGTRIPVSASITLPANLTPADVKVVFKANGQIIGTGTRNPDGSYNVEWNTGSQPEGGYDIIAELQNNQGQLIATSNVGKVTLSNDTPLAITLNSGNVSTVPGTRVALVSTLQVPAGLLEGGAYVEFRQGTRLLGRGTRQADGSFVTNFDTTGYTPGAYPVQAVLVSASGQDLATSNSATVTLAAAPRNAIVLTSADVTSSVGSNVPLTATVTLVSQTINTQQGVKVNFISDGELLGVGVRQPDGSYRLDWNTTGRNIGQYPVKAVLVDSNDNLLAESALGKVTLQSAQSTGIVLSTPTNNSSYVLGSSIPLEATVAITPAQRASGVKVEFFANGQKIADGVDTGSDKYSATFTQPNTGDYPIRAVLKSTSGAVLAESNINNARVATASTNSSGGSGGGGSIGTVNPTPTVNAAIDLTRPIDGGGISLNTPTEIQANATLNPSDVANGYKIRFRDPASSFTQDVVPTRPNTTTTTYTASVVYTPTGATGNRNLIAEVVNGSGTVVGTLTDIHTVNVVNTTVDMQTPADNSAVAPGSANTLSGTAANVPAGGSVRFVVKDSSGNTLTTLPATNTTGNTWESTSPWTAPATTQDVDIEMQVLPAGTENPLVTDTHDIAVIVNTVDTTGPAQNTRLATGSFSNSVTLSSSVPTLTNEQITNGATVFFDVLDSGGNPIAGLSNLLGTQQGDNTWNATANLSTLAEGDYQVRAKVLASNNGSSAVLATDTTPNTITIATPTVDMQSPIDGAIVAPGSSNTLSGTATNVPTNGTVRFVITDSGGGITNIPATNTSGNTWATAPNAWTAPNTSQDVDIEMQVLAPGNTSPVVTDTHDIAVVVNSIDTLNPLTNRALQLNAPGNTSVLLSSNIPVTTAEQLSNTSNSPDEATVYFEIRNTANSTVLGPLQGSAQADNTWQVNANLSGLTAGEYRVVAVLRADNSPTSSVLAEDATPNTFYVVNSSVALNTPVNPTTLNVGANLPTSATALNVPPNGKVSFILVDSGSNTVQTVQDTDLSDNSYSATFTTTGLNLGDYTVVAQVRDANNNVLSQSSTAAVKLAPTGVLNTPLTGTLFYHESASPTLRFTPQDTNGNTLSLAQLNGADIVFTDLDANNTDTTGSQLGLGTRQADGSYTLSWNITNPTEPSGDHRITASIRQGMTSLFSANSTTRLQPYPRSVFIVDSSDNKVYNAYTGTSVGSQNAVIPDLNTGNRDFIFQVPFKALALAKHPTNGSFYYIESDAGPGKKIGRYDPGTGVASVIGTTTTSHGNFTRLAFDTVSRRLYASEGNNVYEVNQLTGALTTIPLSFATPADQTEYNGTGGGGGDLAITPDGYVYLAIDANVFVWKLNASAQTMTGGLYAGAVDLSAFGNGLITSNGFDGDIDTVSGQVRSMLVMTNKSRFLRIPLNTSGTNNRRLLSYPANTAPSQLTTYSAHTSGDMSAAHTGF